MCAVAEATSEYLPAAQADLAKNLEICDLIKSRQASPKETMRSLKRRLEHRNPNVQLLALELTDAAVKNTSPIFLRELVSREFMAAVIAMVAVGSSGGTPPTSGPVTDKARELLQVWALLLGTRPGLGYIREAYEQCRREGVPFPAAPPSHVLTSTIVHTEAPPEWTDSATCERCADAFGVLLRKHHCRRCGRTFCQDCSSKTMALPEMGLYEEVRVCEGCYAVKFAERTGGGEKPLPVPDDGAPEGEGEDDLAKAIRLSLQESRQRAPPPPPSQTAVPGTNDDNYDEEAALAAAIAASLRDSTAVEGRPTIPSPSTVGVAAAPTGTGGTVPAGELDPSPAPPSLLQSMLLVSPIERENVQLFSELIGRMSPQDEELEEADFLKLARDMVALRNRLLDGIDGSSPAPDIQRLLHTLETALARYEQLALTVLEDGSRVGSEEHTGQAHEQDDDHERHVYGLPSTVHGQQVYNPYRIPDLTVMPSRPRSHTGSIMVGASAKSHLHHYQHQHHPAPYPSDDNDGSLGDGEEEGYRDLPSYMKPVPASLVPALQPKRTNSAGRAGSLDDAARRDATAAVSRAGQDKREDREATLIPLTSEDGEEGTAERTSKERDDPLAELTEDVPLIQL